MNIDAEFQTKQLAAALENRFWFRSLADDILTVSKSELHALIAPKNLLLILRETCSSVAKPRQPRFVRFERKNFKLMSLYA